MGISGLWKIIEPTATEVPLECLEGRRLAIDVSIWIYQAQTAYPSDQPYPHLRLLVNRLAKLLFYKIRPVFVFDGPEVPSLKRQVLENRRKRRDQNDDIITNAKKMKQLKNIAGGQLDDVALAKSIQEVISPSKKVVLNDVYKDVPSSSTSLQNSVTLTDRMNYDEKSEESEDDECILIPVEPVKVEEIEVNQSQNTVAARREQIQDLVEKREIMRNSRLHPAMIPSDSKSFSNFQMQRLLQRGRLNSQIEQLTKTAGTSYCTSSDKINVTGPDGTRHVLQYPYSDEVEHVPQVIGSREIDSIYQPPLEMTLDIFNVQYGGKDFSREATPDDEREEVAEKLQERLISMKERGYQSKSGMLEAIARKRVREHYGGVGNDDRKLDEEYERRQNLEEESELPIVSEEDMALQSALLESAAKNLSEKMNQLPKETLDSREEEEEEWDPQRYDVPSTSNNPTNDSYTHLTYEENDKTPEMYRDLQEFLTNCGIPWVEAPGEAEAQCVELERLGLVDGVVSDDSDVWAFGVRNVYRHMFSKNKRVQRYDGGSTNKKAECKMFCLKREDYISIALLSGGDYCAGLNKVGAIGALELIAEFVEKRIEIEDLNAVECRVMKLLENIRKLFTSPIDEAGLTVTRNAMKLKRQVTEANEEDDIKMVCSNLPAVQAYLHPSVDSSSERFRWRQLNVILVRNFLHQRLQWSDRGQNHEEKHSLDAFEKWNSFLAAGGTSQLRLDRFFAQPLDNTLVLTWSKRVSDALEKIGKRSHGIEEVEIVEKNGEPKEKQPAKAAKRMPATKSRTRKATKKRAPKGKGSELPKKLNLSEESSSDDSFDEAISQK